jgi:hypothetical protein
MPSRLIAARPGHRHAALAARGGLARTFGSLAGFLASLLLGTGLYLIADAWRHPVRAQAGAVIAGACAIALGITVLGYLLKSHRSPALHGEGNRSARRQPLQSQLPREGRRAEMVPHLTFQRIYADKCWIESPRDRHP